MHFFFKCTFKGRILWLNLENGLLGVTQCTGTLVDRAIPRQSPKAVGAVLGFSSGDGDMRRYLGTFLELELAELSQIWIQQVKKSIVKDDIVSGLDYGSSTFQCKGIR